MPIKSLSQSSLTNFQKYSSLLAGNEAYIPFISDYDLLETEILTGTTASVTFSSLNSTYGADYQHLQLRTTTRGTTGDTAKITYIQFNSDTTGYARHALRGDGSSVSSSAGANQTQIEAGFTVGNGSGANIFAASVIDILDPFETSKNTTVKGLTGQNGSSNFIELFSGLWIDTSAVDSIKIYPAVDSWVTGCRFSLYGLKKAA